MPAAAPEPEIVLAEDSIPAYVRGAAWPAWLYVAIPGIILMFVLYQSARRQIRWFSLLVTFGLFEAMLLVAEHNSVLRGHWVYNTSRILGPKLWGVPIEEPLLWYSVPVFVVIFLFETLCGVHDRTVQWHPAHALHWRPMKLMLTPLGIRAATLYPKAA